MSARTDAAVERNRRSSRDAKRRRRGLCVDCGAETRYNGSTVNGPSLRCRNCAAVAAGRAKSGTGDQQQRLLDLLGDGRDWRRADILDALGMTGRHGWFSQLVARLLKQGLIERPRRAVYRRVAA